MNDDQHFLANAYVDGELTADERRIAESDPDVMSEVGLLVALHDQIRAMDPPDTGAREAAIAAAMSHFGPAAAVSTQPVVDHPVPVTRVVDFQRRSWSTRYLGVAAGLVVIGLLGVVVVSSLRASGDDDAASEAVADDATAAYSVEVTAADRIIESTDDDLAQVGDGTADMSAAELAPAADEPAGAPAEKPASEAAADSDMSDAGSARPVIDPDQPLTTPAELGAYGSYLVELQQSGELPPTPNTKCSQPGILGRTQYLFDNVPVDVLIAVDDTARSTTAIDPDTCGELVVGPLF